MLISEMSMPEFAEAVKRIPTAILPLGAVEQHGPHLPLGLDAMHAMALAQKTASLRPCLVAPPVYYGMCRSTKHHPGTIGIGGDTLRALIRDIATSLAYQGLKNLCLLTGHAGGTHTAALIEAGEQLLETTHLNLAVVCVLDLLDEVRPLLACPRDSHAGEVETSLALFLWPELVKGSAPEEYPDFPPFLLTRHKHGHWPGGVWGDPSQASAEKGRQILEAEARALARVLQRLEEAAP